MSKCLHCRPGMRPSSPGAHHAVDCPLYRSEFRGDHAAFWKKQANLLFAWWGLFR